MHAWTAVEIGQSLGPDAHSSGYRPFAQVAYRFFRSKCMQTRLVNPADQVQIGHLGSADLCGYLLRYYCIPEADNPN